MVRTVAAKLPTSGSKQQQKKLEEKPAETCPLHAYASAVERKARAWRAKRLPFLLYLDTFLVDETRDFLFSL